MRIVGKLDRTELEPDAAKAMRRGRALDAVLKAVAPPVPRGVSRGTHAYFNRIDDQRWLLVARKINRP